MSEQNELELEVAYSDAHLNWMGGPSWTVGDPIYRLRLAASSCFFGEPQYYHDTEEERQKGGRRPRTASQLGAEDLTHLRDTLNALDPVEWRGLTPKVLMERAIDEALAHDAEATLREAVRLRREEHIRTTPQVILVRAANHAAVRGTGLVRRYAPGVIGRADEPAVGLAYQLDTFGRPVPNALKRAWRDALEKLKPWQLAKYRMERRVVKTVDVVNLVHPRGEAINQLVRGELTTTGQTWESIISAQGSTQEAWQGALEVMGHMALLRNLRNLLQANVAPEAFVEKLVAGAATGKQLPFRYWSAWNAVGADAPASVKGGIEACLKQSLGALPRFGGRVMSLCDNSGSATGTTTSSLGSVRIATIANLSAVLTGMVADEGWVGVFGDRLERFKVDPRQSVFQQVDKADKIGQGIGGGTENGIWLFWDRAIRERERWDSVFVYSDMQAGHGGLYGVNAQAEYPEFIWRKAGAYIDVPKLIQRYREQVNPDVMVYLVQVAGYQDTIVPEFYDRTFILGGWGEGLLRFAAAMSGLYAKPAT